LSPSIPIAIIIPVKFVFQHITITIRIRRRLNEVERAAAFAMGLP
jgi:hypothetical protein